MLEFEVNLKFTAEDLQNLCAQLMSKQPDDALCSLFATVFDAVDFGDDQCCRVMREVPDIIDPGFFDYINNVESTIGLLTLFSRVRNLYINRFDVSDPVSSDEPLPFG